MLLHGARHKTMIASVLIFAVPIVGFMLWAWWERRNCRRATAREYRMLRMARFKRWARTQQYAGPDQLQPRWETFK
jgi:hypothetical protein